MNPARHRFSLLVARMQPACDVWATAQNVSEDADFRVRASRPDAGSPFVTMEDARIPN
jgi:hypothetical protein